MGSAQAEWGGAAERRRRGAERGGGRALSMSPAASAALGRRKSIAIRPAGAPLPGDAGWWSECRLRRTPRCHSPPARGGNVMGDNRSTVPVRPGDLHPWLQAPPGPIRERGCLDGRDAGQQHGFHVAFRYGAGGLFSADSIVIAAKRYWQARPKQRRPVAARCVSPVWRTLVFGASWRNRFLTGLGLVAVRRNRFLTGAARICLDIRRNRFLTGAARNGRASDCSERARLGLLGTGAPRIAGSGSG